jgi:hypothetical protein
MQTRVLSLRVNQLECEAKWKHLRRKKKKKEEQIFSAIIKKYLMQESRWLHCQQQNMGQFHPPLSPPLPTGYFHTSRFSCKHEGN